MELCPHSSIRVDMNVTVAPCTRSKRPLWVGYPYGVGRQCRVEILFSCVNGVSIHKEAGIGLIWLGIGTSERGNECSVFIKRRRVS